VFAIMTYQPQGDGRSSSTSRQRVNGEMFARSVKGAVQVRHETGGHAVRALLARSLAPARESAS